MPHTTRRTRESGNDSGAAAKSSPRSTATIRGCPGAPRASVTVPRSPLFTPTTRPVSDDDTVAKTLPTAYDAVFAHETNYRETQ